MLRSLDLKNVGPSRALTLSDIAPRFNLFAGDNGLGKSFLLDIAWWALTRTWHETPAVPSTPDASIAYQFDGDRRPHKDSSVWNPKAQAWRRKPGRPPNPGLVIYARVDGSFSTWDPMRNYRLWVRADGGESQSPDAYQFTSREVMEGIRRHVHEAGIQREQVLCRGLVDDWTRWQATNSTEFQLLVRLLNHLGPDEQPLRPGPPQRVSLDDAREVPTIRMPYGTDVPITYAPAGVRRMTKLAYLLAWTLHEHEQEAARIGQPLSRQVIVLIDEPETHLHPRWQRTVLPSLNAAIRDWNVEHAPEVQFLVATHSPLILASMEPVFDPSRDKLWKLELDQTNEVRIRVETDYRRGDVNRWLTSDVFGLGSATSRELQDLLVEAYRLLENPDRSEAATTAMEARLREALPEFDPLLARWSFLVTAARRPEQPA